MSDELEKASENYAEQLTVAEKMIELNTEEISMDLQYATLNKEELRAAAEELVHATDVKKAYNQLQAIRNAMDDLLDQERPSLIRTWVEAGNDPRDFVAPIDNTKQIIQQIITTFKKRREEERKRALEWWMAVSRPVKCEPEVEKYNRKNSCFRQDFGEDDA